MRNIISGKRGILIIYDCDVWLIDHFEIVTDYTEIILAIEV